MNSPKALASALHRLRALRESESSNVYARQVRAEFWLRSCTMIRNADMGAARETESANSAPWVTR
jgi:hypothetical protein